MTTNSLDRSAVDAIRRDISQRLATQCEGDLRASLLHATATRCRDTLLQRWATTQADDAQRGAAHPVRRVHYLSMEFLMGRALHNALAALGWVPALTQLCETHGVALSDVLESEADAALGNGGLGRLAACFLDSFAELGLPSFGYGLRYQYGMFAQAIQDGRQIEQPDDWMRNGNPWEIARPELQYRVGFGGRVVQEGAQRHWIPAEVLQAEAFDFIVPAQHSERVATLRQWHAKAATPIDFVAFSRGDFAQAARHCVAADALNWVLYPDDSTEAGRELRLKQEAFLVSASLQDLIARHVREFGDLHSLGLRNAIHLNDTHPALAPIELLRLLIDEQGLSWDAAWKIVRQAVSYTNHTLMPEALETWPVAMFERLLPRHLELIYQLNQYWLDSVRERVPGDADLIARVSLIDEQHGRRVRMAALSIIASHRVNGVAELHSKLMVQTIFADFAKLLPTRFHNVTNGVTPRRWLAQANPALADFLDARIGAEWRRDLRQLSRLGALASDSDTQQSFLAIKHANKQALANWVRRELGVVLDPSSLFDVQVKRIHEYKRQLLNLLHVVARYQAILANPAGPDRQGWVPRTVILAGKAASAYHTAKQIIRLANDIARVINSDPRIGSALRLVFVPNYSVSLAERIIPAADLSEQISTAGTEASGTGNMKFALNGACTLGTWDGANIEMAEAMGVAQMFTFGLRTDAIADLQRVGYDPRLYVEQNRALQRVLRAIASGEFSPGEPARYVGLIDGLLQRDVYFLLADFAAYVEAQHDVDQCYRDRAAWAERALRNVAGMGRFSTDRTIAEYVDRVWSVASLCEDATQAYA